MAITTARFWVVMSIIIASFVLVAGTTFAAGNSGETKPGWGFGDTNHEHTGPPGGPSTHPVK
jgi:hypothetical protein